MSNGATCTRPAVRFGDAVFVKLQSGQWTLGEVINIAPDSSSIRVKFCPQLSADAIATSDTTVHRTHKETYSIDSPLWRRDYKLLQQIQLRRKRHHEEKAIQARYNRVKKDWELEDRQRDWSRTWSCKSRKEQLKQTRRQRIERLAHQALLAATDEQDARPNGAPIHSNTSSQVAKQQLSANQIQPVQHINRHRFDPLQWAEYAAQQQQIKLSKHRHEEDEVAICDEIEREILESPDFASICSNSSDEERSDCDSDSSYADDGFYLSEEDISSLYGSSSLAFFDSVDCSNSISFLEDDHETISLSEGDIVDIEDEKTGFLRTEYGPKLVKLLPTERVLSSSPSIPL
eukprot:TRINITY_DN8521_c0_g1_i1.p1 TRINITY_DN8521_c0_g1~~TRINITY_DN8521_c0_g1_i1.p1  ORF type:complete len:346 (-),score=58.36 TRINITY_DN8521_c0_g1_i1:536-1573(-)